MLITCGVASNELRLQARSLWLLHQLRQGQSSTTLLLLTLLMQRTPKRLALRLKMRLSSLGISGKER